MRVAIQGERGSYSEEAARIYFKSLDFELLTKDHLDEVFDSVQSGEADYGVIPVENSTTGSIRKSLDLLLERDVRVIGEVKVKVSHALMSVKGRIEDVKVVYSHPEAIAQCEKFLKGRNWIVVPSLDTAGAARIVADANDASLAAIASERAASIYGLKILARDIQDIPLNITRFFVISLRDQISEDADTTAAFFATSHKPGSLWRALGAFARRNINLLWLESRPIKGEPWNYSFYVEFEGSINEYAVREAIRELEELTIWIKILGSYRRMIL